MSFIKGRNTIINSIISLMLIASSFVIVSVQLASGQVISDKTGNANSLILQNIPSKKIQVGDTDIAYKVFGKGDPILLISGSGSPMDYWDPTILKDLASNHTVIIFDNRGVGNSTAGTKPFSIIQFANDTAGLLDALKAQKADILGYSMGTFIGQELVLLHPEKVNRLILVAASCGGKENIPRTPEVVKISSSYNLSQDVKNFFLSRFQNHGSNLISIIYPFHDPQKLYRLIHQFSSSRLLKTGSQPTGTVFVINFQN